MPYPNVYVDIDFVRSPYYFLTTRFQWTDVTSYVRGISINRGRSDETANFEAGTAQIVLDNRDRRFDPFYTSGPYYGNLKPRRNIRVQASNGGRNLIGNASFEVNFDGWEDTSTNSVLSTDAYSGQYAAQVTASVASTDARLQTELYLTAGTSYTFSAYLKNTVGATRQHQLEVIWLDSNGTPISTSTGTATNITAGGVYTRLVETFTAPTGTVSARFFIYIQKNNAAIGNRTLIDAVLVNPGSTAATFFETYTLFRGFIEGWPVELSDAGYDSTVTLSCFDLLGLLADQELPDDLADYDIRNLQPRHYWPLTEPVDSADSPSAVAYDYGYRPQNLIPTAGTSVTNGSAMAAAITDTSLIIDAGGPIQNTPTPYDNKNRLGLTVTSGTVMLWWEIADPTVSQTIFEVGFLLEIKAIYDFAADRIIIDFWNGTNVYRYQTAVLSLDANIPHHLAVRYRENIPTIAPTINLDGTIVPVTLVSTTASARTITEYARLYLGQYQHFAIFDSSLGTAVSDIYGLSASRLTQSTSARALRIVARYSDVPSTFLTRPSSPDGTVSDISAGGPSVVAELQLVADSEGGNLYVTSGGQLTLTQRRDIFAGRSITSQATFGTGGVSIGPVARYRLDASTMRNQLSLGVAGDASIEIGDDTSVTNNGAKSGTWSTQIATIPDGEDLATLLIGFYKDPVLTLDPFEVNIAAVAADWETVMRLELLDRISVTIPQKVGSNLSTEQLIQSITYQITPGEWTTTITGSTRFTNPFIIGQSLLGGPDLLI